MPFQLDTRMLHLAGDLLAGGSGVFSGDDARTLVDAAKADRRIPVEELAGLFLVNIAVEPIADERAAQVFDEVVDAGSRWQPELGPWLASHYTAGVLQAGARLMAGRGKHRLGPEVISAWLAEVQRVQFESIRPIGSEDGTVERRSLERACLAVAELWHGHVTPAGRRALDALLEGWRAEGLTIGSDSAGATPSGVAGTSSSSSHRELVGTWEHSTYTSVGGLSISRVSVLELRQDGRFAMSSDVVANMTHRDMCGDETGRTSGSAGGPHSGGRWAADGKTLRLDWDSGGQSVYGYEADAEGMLWTPVASTSAQTTYWNRLS